MKVRLEIIGTEDDIIKAVRLLFKAELIINGSYNVSTAPGSLFLVSTTFSSMMES